MEPSLGTPIQSQQEELGSTDQGTGGKSPETFLTVTSGEGVPKASNE